MLDEKEEDARPLHNTHGLEAKMAVQEKRGGAETKRGNGGSLYHGPGKRGKN